MNPFAVEEATILDTIFVDGTFHATPLGCYQLLVIFRFINGKVSLGNEKRISNSLIFLQPWFYGLAIMEHRRKSLYKLIFEEIKFQTTAQPAIFMSDYENASRAAAKAVWPMTETPGCTFHYRQAVRKHYMSKVFPKPDKLTPEATAHSITKRMVYNLQFLPKDQMEQGWTLVKAYQTNSGVQQHFLDFNDYFETYWLRQVKPENFSMFLRYHRTNNICEAFNAQLKKLLFKGPNVYTFMQRLVNITKEENEKRQKDQYKASSKMTRNLEAGWNALRQREVDVEEFLKLNFSAPNMVI